VLVLCVVNKNRLASQRKCPRANRQQSHSPRLIPGDIRAKESLMAAIVLRNISPDTHRALRARARKHGRTTEAKIRQILDHAARPAARMRLGSTLAALAKPFGGLDLNVARDKTPADPVDVT